MSGYQMPGCSIGVMFEYPNRKSPVLYAGRDNYIWPLAYFRTREDAEMAERLLGLLAKGALGPDE